MSEIAPEGCFLPSGISSWSQVGVNTGINANEVSRLSPSDSFFFYPSSTISFCLLFRIFSIFSQNLKDFIWRRGEQLAIFIFCSSPDTHNHSCISVALSKTSSGFFLPLPAPDLICEQLWGPMKKALGPGLLAIRERYGTHMEEEMATHSSILLGKTPRIEEPGGLQSMGSQRVDHDWETTHVIPTLCL